MDARSVKEQIERVITILIESSICLDQEFPAEKNGRIGLIASDLSYMLRESPYAEVYSQCASRRHFNVCLLDGAFLQFQYRFDSLGRNILKHRLLYMPNPDIESYCENPDFEAEWLSDVLFSDIKKPSAIQFPIRFDFDSGDQSFQAGWHSKSHMTLGNVDECRIPVKGPVSPYRFIDFVLRCFYAKKYKESIDLFQCNLAVSETLQEQEVALIHINFI